MSHSLVPVFIEFTPKGASECNPKVLAVLRSYLGIIAAHLKPMAANKQPSGLLESLEALPALTLVNTSTNTSTDTVDLPETLTPEIAHKAEALTLKTLDLREGFGGSFEKIFETALSKRLEDLGPQDTLDASILLVAVNATDKSAPSLNYVKCDMTLSAVTESGHGFEQHKVRSLGLQLTWTGYHLAHMQIASAEDFVASLKKSGDIIDLAKAGLLKTFNIQTAQ